MTDASKTRLFLTFQKSLVPSLIFFETVWKPYLFLKAHYKRWIRRRKFRQTAYSAHKSLTYSAPISLPSQRKRTLSILSTSEEPRPTIWTRILHPGTQHTNPQKQCFLLTKLPLELRHQIYQHILCSRVLHIIPSLVPSLTKPPHDSTNIETTLTRLDYEPCKWDEDTLIYGKANHSACAIWINGDGELYFRAPKAIVKGNKVETGFLRWWCRKGGMLNLLKTCRLM
ncbi:hypothetical protein CC78DRAFT_267923 [Lojkania enalia]|uniref:DUF7730 domain-containing protein n=1 Tax=Lojkania enalia TaxID=147567 RepID=A0A9P4K6D0_9PLEO|nr:hypothetical protein CC78DRAFT_267923 [Didymosphaeria enalia]